jgi:hypothetical protein
LALRLRICVTIRINAKRIEQRRNAKWATAKVLARVKPAAAVNGVQKDVLLGLLWRCRSRKKEVKYAHWMLSK